MVMVLLLRPRASREALKNRIVQRRNSDLNNPDRFPDDRSKIIFMLRKLSGDTAKWAQPLNQWVLNKSEPDVTDPPLTLAKFITSFNGYFLDPEHCGAFIGKAVAAGLRGNCR
ncbi:hypothetical protein VP01_674g3 [Puccinia sorghi]|uniref:Uncharacterized protein n=1 Tax=Puccinia sorghi TaxID=27349 RepID=A0A0L6UGV3_9BASI|nr:hypothetical protein VP01_674g3 [Puccinia sorghi]